MKKSVVKRIFSILLSCAVLTGIPAFTISVNAGQSTEKTERLLLSYNSATGTEAGTASKNALNRASTLNIWQWSKGGYYFNTDKTAAVTNNILTLDKERYRVCPDTTYTKSDVDSERVYYKKAIENFSDCYITFKIASCDKANFTNISDLKVGLSQTAADMKSEAKFLKLENYIDIDKLKSSSEVFYDVKIPVSDFLAYGEFKALGGSDKTEASFNDEKINGIAFAASMDVDIAAGKLLFAINNAAITSINENDSHSADFRTVDSSAGGSDYSVFYDDKYVKTNYLLQSGCWSAEAADKVKIGDKSVRIVIKGANTEPRIYYGMSYKLVRCADLQKTALSFWYNPQYKREQTYVSILSQCVNNNSSANKPGKVSMLKISLTDYLNLTDDDYGKNEWIKVNIPLKYFYDSGEFDAFLGDDTQFAWHTLCGMALEFSNENIPATDTTVAYADDIKLVNTENTPENLTYFADANSVTVNWSDGLADNGSYEVYRGDRLLDKCDGICTYTDNNAASGKAYTYGVRKTSKDGISTVAAVTAAYMPDELKTYGSNNCTGAASATVFKIGDKAYLEWKGSQKEYVIYKNSQPYGIARGSFFEDFNCSDTDVYTICAADHKNKMLYLPTAVTEIQADNARLSVTAGFADALMNQCPQNGSGSAVPKYLVGKAVNYTGKAFESSLILAFYDKDALSSARVMNFIINQGTTEMMLPLDYSISNTADYTVKAFLWNASKELAPLTGSQITEYTSSPKESDTVVTVLPQKYQKITGWGISPFAFSKYNFEDFQNIDDWKQLYDKTYRELGITTIRVPFDKECAEDNGEIKQSALDLRVKYIKNAMEYGINDYIISFWSGPWCWIENHENEVTWTKDQWHLIEGKEQAYCDYIVDCLRCLENNGVGLPKAVSFQNEPQDGRQWPTYSKEQYIKVTKLLRKTLDNAGYQSVLLMSPETASYFYLYRYMGGSTSAFDFSELENDPEFADAIGVFAVHSYHQVSIGSKDSDIANFAAQTSKYSEKERWQTEFSGVGKDEEIIRYSGGKQVYDRDIGNALFTMRILSSDVGWAGMNRWYYWQAYRTHYNLTGANESYDVLNNEYGQQTLLFGQPGQNVHSGKLYDALRILFNSVPVGSVVKRTSCTNPSVANQSGLRSDILAFETKNGTVIMFLNVTDSDMTVDFKGLNGTSAKISFISGEVSGVQTAICDIDDNGSICGIHVPPKCIAFVAATN
ncbi:MAG: hypothetical protein ACI4DY_07335 [Monoglobaceae bacterium]